MNGAQPPVVSVIIPAYNRAGMLIEAVESVLAQTYSDYELIIIDDGSTDETQALLKSFRQPLSVYGQENRGVSAARNKGAALAKGKYLAFLDSDDLWLPDKLNRQMNFFHQNQAALICQTEEIWIRRGQRVNPKNRHQKPSGRIFLPSLSLCLVSPSAVMIRKDLFEEMHGFDESLPACEDYDLWLRISCRYPIYLLDEALIIKRGGHAGQLSAGTGLDRYRIRSLQKILETESLSMAEYQAAVAKLKEKCAIYANGCLRRGRNHEALYYQRLAEKFMDI